ncbi:MAG: beta-propeller domain-containing protein [Myxococcales bacterium]|nr:beta-propeller domain-containing protein [Myxococcales bacterium]
MAPVRTKPAPPKITTSMAGDPSPAALAEARLLASGCDDFAERRKASVQAELRRMHDALDAALQGWREEQPECWAESRRQAEQRRLEANGSTLRGLAGIGSGYGSGGGAMRAMGSAGASLQGAAAGAAPRPGPVTSARAHSSTNNQIAGVDEADIVKTDGKYVYLALNGALRIVEAMHPRVVSTTPLPGTVRELFVQGDRAVVYTSRGGAPRRCTYGYDCAFAGDGTSTEVTVLDLKDRAQPRVTRTLGLTGSLMTARRVGTVVHTVVADDDVRAASYPTWPAGLATCGTPEKVVRARFAKLRAENEARLNQTARFPSIRDRGGETPLCGHLLRSALDDGHAFTSLVSFDLTDDGSPAQTATVESRPGAVFASADTLYMSVVHGRRPQRAGRWYSFYPTTDEVSEIHAFRIGERPEATRYLGSGAVPGHVLNQFAMDEWYGYLRVATTRGRVPSPGVESTLSVLAHRDDGSLVRVGAVEHIAPGEDIRAVRFDDDRGYVVTFKKTDPLFVLDLAQPDKPAILGELKIPGFSTYMHRVDPDHLLSIGFDAQDRGDFAYFDGVLLQLFDVSKPTEPVLLHKEKIGTRGSSSEAATNHLAFNYFPEKGLLGVPMTVCEGGAAGVHGNEITFSGLYVYDVSVERGFHRRGGVDHSSRGVSCSTWWSRATSTVKRSVFLDDLVYSIAGDRVKVQRLGSLGRDEAELPMTP